MKTKLEAGTRASIAKVLCDAGVAASTEAVDEYLDRVEFSTGRYLAIMGQVAEGPDHADDIEALSAMRHAITVFLENRDKLGIHARRGLGQAYRLPVWRHSGPDELEAVCSREDIQIMLGSARSNGPWNAFFEQIEDYLERAIYFMGPAKRGAGQTKENIAKAEFLQQITDSILCITEHDFGRPVVTTRDGWTFQVLRQILVDFSCHVNVETRIRSFRKFRDSPAFAQHHDYLIETQFHPEVIEAIRAGMAE